MLAKDRAATRRGRTAGRISAQSRDLFAGAAASIMSVAYGLSFAALIFAPPLNTWIAYGIAATFIASAIGAAFVALRSSLPFAIAASRRRNLGRDGNTCCNRRRAAHSHGSAR